MMKEKAIEAYEKKKEKDEREAITDAENFYNEALKELKARIGENFTAIKAVEKYPRYTVFDVDGIVMRVGKSQGYYDIYIVKKCDICNEEYLENVARLGGDNDVLAYIGKILISPHNKYDCDNILKGKQPKKEQITEERLLEALRDFIAENTNVG